YSLDCGQHPSELKLSRTRYQPKTLVPTTRGIEPVRWRRGQTPPSQNRIRTGKGVPTARETVPAVRRAPAQRLLPLRGMELTTTADRSFWAPQTSTTSGTKLERQQRTRGQYSDQSRPAHRRLPVLQHQ